VESSFGRFRYSGLIGAKLSLHLMQHASSSDHGGILMVNYSVVSQWGRPVMFVIHIIKHKTLNFALMTTLITHFFYDMLHKHKNLIRGGPPRIKFLCNIL
jgi:hypothetical protein